MSLSLLAFYTTFFSMWVFTPIPIEICYGLLRDALTLLLCGFWQMVCVLIIFSCSNFFRPYSFSPALHSCTIRWSQPRLPFCDMKLTLFCVSTTAGLPTRRFSVCECSPPSPLKFVMECSAMWRILTHFLFVFVCIWQPDGPTSPTFGSNSVAIV